MRPPWSAPCGSVAGAALSWTPIITRCRPVMPAVRTSPSRPFPTGCASIIRISSWPSIRAVTTATRTSKSPTTCSRCWPNAQTRAAAAAGSLPGPLSARRRVLSAAGSPAHRAPPPRAKDRRLERDLRCRKSRRALEDACHYPAFSCEYIANLLEQRERKPEPGALHLTRQQDLLDLELPAPDLSLYDQEGGDR